MSEKRLNVISDSKKGDNIFDTYITFIESQKLKNLDATYYDFLLKIVEVLERNLVDVNSDSQLPKAYKKRLNEITLSILKEWFPVLNFYNSNGDFIHALSYNLYGFSKTFAEGWTYGELGPLAAFFSPSIDYKKIFNATPVFDKKDITITNTKAFISYMTRHNLQHLGDLITRNLSDGLIDELEFSNYKIFHRVDNRIFGVDYLDLLDLDLEEIRNEAKHSKLSELMGDYQLKLFEDSEIVWDIKVTTNENEPNALEFIGAIYSIIAGIEATSEDVEVRISDWGNGSKWVNFKVIIKDYFAREDIKSVIDKGVKAAGAHYLNAPISNVAKTEAETQKLNRETSAIPIEEQSARMHELDIQSKELSNMEKVLELESKRLDNDQKKLQLILTASQMVTSGILKGDSSFQVEINDVLVFANTRQLPLPTMNEIDEHASLQPKSDRDEPTN